MRVLLSVKVMALWNMPKKTRVSFVFSHGQPLTIDFVVEAKFNQGSGCRYSFLSQSLQLWTYQYEAKKTCLGSGHHECRLRVPASNVFFLKKKKSTRVDEIHIFLNR